MSQTWTIKQVQRLNIPAVWNEAQVIGRSRVLVFTWDLKEALPIDHGSCELTLRNEGIDNGECIVVYKWSWSYLCETRVEKEALLRCSCCLTSFYAHVIHDHPACYRSCIECRHKQYPLDMNKLQLDILYYCVISLLSLSYFTMD